MGNKFFFMKETLKTMNEDELLLKIYYSVMGFFLAILAFALILVSLFCVGYGCVMGYQKWFSTTEMVSVGDTGYYYDHAHACFVKPYPNRKVLTGCHGLQYHQSDSIGIVLTNDYKYRYVNLNTLTYINDMAYSQANLFQDDGCAFAIAADSLYTLHPDGSIVAAELADYLYTSISDIICYTYENDDTGELVYTERATNMFRYESNQCYGIMSPEFVRLTAPVYTEIKALSPDVFFCTYDSGLGVLINKNGELIK